jgi:hypothetical protein
METSSIAQASTKYLGHSGHIIEESRFGSRFDLAQAL